MILKRVVSLTGMAIKYVATKLEIAFNFSDISVSQDTYNLNFNNAMGFKILAYTSLVERLEACFQNN